MGRYVMESGAIVDVPDEKAERMRLRPFDEDEDGDQGDGAKPPARRRAAAKKKA